MLKRLDYGLGMINLSQYKFDKEYFILFARMFHPLSSYFNPILFGFQLNNTYYIHLIDENYNVFSVVPFKLASNINDFSWLVDNSFYTLEKGLQEFLIKNPGYKGCIGIYMCDIIVDSVDFEYLVDEYVSVIGEFGKFLINGEYNNLHNLYCLSLFKDDMFSIDKD